MPLSPSVTYNQESWFGPVIEPLQSRVDRFGSVLAQCDSDLLSVIRQGYSVGSISLEKRPWIAIMAIPDIGIRNMKSPDQPTSWTDVHR